MEVEKACSRLQGEPEVPGMIGNIPVLRRRERGSCNPGTTVRDYPYPSYTI